MVALWMIGYVRYRMFMYFIGKLRNVMGASFGSVAGGAVFFDDETFPWTMDPRLQDG